MDLAVLLWGSKMDLSKIDLAVLLLAVLGGGKMDLSKMDLAVLLLAVKSLLHHAIISLHIMQ